VNKLIEVLRDFKLSDYEIKVLLTLVSEGELTASEIAEKSGIPRTSVYEVVKSLEKKGFVICQGKPLKVRALSAEQLVKMFAKKLEEKMKVIEKLTEIEKARKEEVVSVYRGDVVFDIIETVLRDSKRVIVASLNMDEKLEKIIDSIECEKFVRKRERGGSVVHSIIVADDKVVLFVKHGGEVNAIVGGGEFAKFYLELLSSFMRDLPFSVKK